MKIAFKEKVKLLSENSGVLLKAPEHLRALVKEIKESDTFSYEKKNFPFSSELIKTINSLDEHIQQLEPGYSDTGDQYSGKILNLFESALKILESDKVKGQSWLEDRMLAVGYKLEKGGHCYGVANMARQAFLADDMDTFNKRLQIIENMPVEDFENDFAILRQKQKQYIDEARIDDANVINNKMIDILAFFDGVVLYQQPDRAEYEELFSEKIIEQDSSKTMPLVLPSALEKEKKPVDIQSFTGSYNKDELILYLNTLQQHLGHNSFAINTSCSRHTVSLNYDHIEKQWLIINPNRLPGEAYSHTDLLADELLSGFKQKDGLVMLTELSVNKENEGSMQAAFLTMKQTSDWRNLHNPSESKINQIYPPDKFDQLHYLNQIKNYDASWIKEAISVHHDLLKLIDRASLYGEDELRKSLIAEQTKRCTKTTSDLVVALRPKTPDDRLIILNGMKKNLPEMIKSDIDVFILLRELTPEHRMLVYDTIKHKLPYLTDEQEQASTIFFKAFKDFLPEKIATIQSMLAFMKNLTNIASDEDIKAFASALMSDDPEKIKTQFNHLVKNTNRSDELTNALSTLEPVWLKKINKATGLNLTESSTENKARIKQHFTPAAQPTLTTANPSETTVEAAKKITKFFKDIIQTRKGDKVQGKKKEQNPPENDNNSTRQI